MKTGNFDVVVEIHEELINKALAAAFYSGFMYKRGEFKLKTEKLPPSIKNLLEVNYELRLRSEPLLDVIEAEKVRLLFAVEASLILADGFRSEFDVNFSVEGTLHFNRPKNLLELDLTEAILEKFEINEKHDLPRPLFNAANELLRLIVLENLTGKWELISVKDPVFSAKLPKMPEGDAYRLPVHFEGFKTFNRNTIALCFNVLNYNGGTLAQVLNFMGKNNYAIGITEAAMHRVFDFWWEHTTFSKNLSKDKVLDIPALASFLDFIGDTVDIATKLGSLGFLETDWEVEKVWIEYGASITLRKPHFDLKDGNILEITNSEVEVDVYARAKARVSVAVEVDTSGLIPDWLTPWDDDIEISRKISTMTLFSLSMNDLIAQIVLARGQILINDENQLVGSIDEIDFHLDLGDAWFTHLPEWIINKILDFVENMVLEKIDNFVLFPAIIAKKIPKTDFNLEVDLNILDVDEHEVVVAAMVDVLELKSPVRPVPVYVANKNPESMEVHRHDCYYVERMNEANKVGYFVLYDAFRDGYDGCKFCIPKYHTR